MIVNITESIGSKKGRRVDIQKANMIDEREQDHVLMGREREGMVTNMMKTLSTVRTSKKKKKTKYDIKQDGVELVKESKIDKEQ